jgi:hypothetical protein
MPSPGDNRHRVSHRNNRGLIAALAVVVLVLGAVGVFYSTGQWSGEATNTGAGAPTAQVPPGAGSNAPVPNR